ncbi:MAG TPA: anti-sigma factor [Usitatibacter sp.]|jgi:anti-sigma-K factor RskA|nr:anti-sigma factor [Usitatibacter sp.]
MRKVPANLAHALAAEYVLGTLRGRARERLEAIARADPQVAGIIHRWEAGLTPLADRVPPVEPPARVWERIAQRIGPTPTSPGFRATLGFWRSFGLLAGGVASVLLAAFLYLSGGAREQPMMFVAVLTAPDAVPRMVVSMHPPGMLRARMVKPWTGAEGKSLELWAIPEEGAPRSLGLVDNRMGDTMMPMPPGDPRMQGAKQFAVSLEPAGGSPTKQPTGPVVCSGAIAPVRLKT